MLIYNRLLKVEIKDFFIVQNSAVLWWSIHRSFHPDMPMVKGINIWGFSLSRRTSLWQEIYSESVTSAVSKCSSIGHTILNDWVTMYMFDRHIFCIFFYFASSFSCHCWCICWTNLYAPILTSRNLVSASQDGKLIVWDGYTTNKVCRWSK